MTRPGNATLVLREVRWEQTAFWRQPVSVAFTAAFPIMLLVIFGTLNRGSRIDFYGGIRVNQYYTPAIITFCVMSACYTTLAMQLSIRRENGQLLRLRGTPLPPWAYLAGLIGNSFAVSVVLSALVSLIGVQLYDVQLFWSRLPAFLLALVVGVVVFCSLGILITVIIPSSDAAPAVVNFALFPLLFLSGTFYPIPPDSALSKVMDWLPLRPFTLSVFRTFDPRSHGLGFSARDLLVLLGWGVVAALLAVRFFRWQPRNG